MGGGFPSKLEAAWAVADAVLLEGRALYPHRAAAASAQPPRWTFGVLAPRAWSEAGGVEAWWLESHVLVHGAPRRISGQLRFFQIERRRVEQIGRDGAFHPVDVLEVDRRRLVGWDEGVLRSVDLEIDLEAGARPTETRFEIEGRTEIEPAGDGRVILRRLPLAGRIEIRAEWITRDPPLARIAIRVENETAAGDPRAPRDEAVAAAFASTHLALAAEGAEFLSLLAPPPWARDAAAGCTNVRTFPVLVGPHAERGVVLSAPILLYDHPQIAPERRRDPGETAELDELLTLRRAAEPREGPAIDAWTPEVFDRAVALSDDWFERLHGAPRDLRDIEMVPRSLAPGRRVRLRPAGGAEEARYTGRIATIVGVRDGADGSTYLALALDDDPAPGLHPWNGRYHYYRPDEVELL